MRLNEIHGKAEPTADDKRYWEDVFLNECLQGSQIGAKWSRNEDGTINTTGGFVAKVGGSLPVKFHKCSGSFMLMPKHHMGWVYTLEGSPEECTIYSVSGAQAMPADKWDVNHLPIRATEIRLNDTNIQSLAGIHKRVRSCKLFSASDVPQSSILGLFMIPDLQEIAFYKTSRTLSDMLNDELQKPVSQRDLHELQEKMIEMGFAKQAKI